MSRVLSTGGACSRRGVPGLGGLLRGVPGLGGCLVETPGTATAADVTHPTGMHSCFLVYLQNYSRMHSNRMRTDRSRCQYRGDLCPEGKVGSLFGGCLSRGGSPSRRGLCPGGLCPGGLCPWGSLSMGVSVHGGALCPGGSLSRGSLSKGISVQRSLGPWGSLSMWVSVQRGLPPEGVSVQTVSLNFFSSRHSMNKLTLNEPAKTARTFRKKTPELAIQ